jgi:malate dehydrogenase
MNAAPRVAKSNFFAMTSLDENRAKAQLAKKANVAIEAVSTLAIWGNHSATQYPDFYHAKIEGKPVIEVIKDTQWLQTEFIAKVQQRGAEIIKARGLSSAASAANAVITGLQALTQPAQSTGGHFYSMAKCSQGEYGIEEGLIFSFPSKTINGKCETVLNLEHTDFSQQKIKETYEELKAERDAVRSLNLIP